MTAPALPVECAAAGAWVTTVDGRRLLNCGGYGVLTFGAGHPTVVRRVTEQLGRLAFGSKTLPHQGEQPAADAVRSVLPDGLTEVAFASTGAEAVEMALRLVRLNRCKRIVTTTGGFHGRTFGALSVNGADLVRRPYLPLLDGVTVVPYGDAAAVRAALADGDGKAAVIVEPVQGEAGVHVPAPDYLAEVAAACAEHGALLVADEVQTGLGRLGHRWGVDRSEVVPDVLVMGKALGGGVLPVSGIAARPAAFTPFRRDPRQATATFSGYPLAAAAVTAAVDVLRDEDVPGRAQKLGAALGPVLAEVADRTGELVTQVRGLGALHGIEFAHPRTAARFGTALVDHGVVPSYSMATTSTVRLTPSALLDEPELEHLSTAVLAAADAVVAASREGDR
jgi:putrescine aminotransferase